MQNHQHEKSIKIQSVVKIVSEMQKESVVDELSQFLRCFCAQWWLFCQFSRVFLPSLPPPPPAAAAGREAWCKSVLPPARRGGLQDLH